VADDDPAATVEEAVELEGAGTTPGRREAGTSDERLRVGAARHDQHDLRGELADLGPQHPAAECVLAPEQFAPWVLALGRLQTWRRIQPKAPSFSDECRVAASCRARTPASEKSAGAHMWAPPVERLPHHEQAAAIRRLVHRPVQAHLVREDVGVHAHLAEETVIGRLEGGREGSGHRDPHAWGVISRSPHPAAHSRRPSDTSRGCRAVPSP
jgi:hypothetical protein